MCLFLCEHEMCLFSVSTGVQMLTEARERKSGHRDIMTGGCEVPDVGDGNKSWILSESSVCSCLLSPHSSSLPRTIVTTSTYI